MIKKRSLSDKDIKTWDEYIKDPKDIYDKEKAQSPKKPTKERFIFDLHGYGLDDANVKVRKVINFCVSNNYKELLLITGKGIHSTNSENAYVSKDLGKLKFSVPNFIRNDKELSKYIYDLREAPKKYGGDGAFILKLRKFIK